MKKFLIGLLVLVVLIGGGAYYLVQNLDNLVERAIETAGTEAVGSEVQVGAVAIDLGGGTATISDFTIANPEGYSADSLLRFGELAVALDLSNISSQSIGIRSVVARQPRVFFEQRGRTSNFDVLLERLNSGGAEPAPPEEPGVPSNLQLTIDSVLVEEIGAGLNSDLLADPVEVELGSIELENLSGTPTEVAHQALTSLLTQVSRSAANAMLGASGEQLRDSAEAAGQQLLDRAAESAGDAGERVQEGVGNLLNRGNDETEGQ